MRIGIVLTALSFVAAAAASTGLHAQGSRQLWEAYGQGFSRGGGYGTAIAVVGDVNAVAEHVPGSRVGFIDGCYHDESPRSPLTRRAALAFFAEHRDD